MIKNRYWMFFQVIYDDQKIYNFFLEFQQNKLSEMLDKNIVPSHFSLRQKNATGKSGSDQGEMQLAYKAAKLIITQKKYHRTPQNVSAGQRGHNSSKNINDNNNFKKLQLVMIHQIGCCGGLMQLEFNYHLKSIIIPFKDQLCQFAFNGRNTEHLIQQEDLK